MKAGKLTKIISLVLSLSLLLPIVFSEASIAAETVDYSTLQNLTKGFTDVVVLKDGARFAIVRGNKINIDAGNAPYIQDGIGYMPLRFASRIQDCETEWSDINGTATVPFLQYELIFELGSKFAVKLERCSNIREVIEMDGPAQFGGNGSLYVPIKGFADAAGFEYYENKDGVMIYGSNIYRRGGLFENGRTITSVDFAAAFADDFDSERTDLILYVDPKNGRNSGTGTAISPLRTIEVAKEKVREYKSTNSQNGDIIVYLREGQYYLDKGLEFNEKDSGENGYDIIYRAYPGETPVINGGRYVRGWTHHEGNIYKAYIGEGVKVDLVFENGTFGTKARYPNEGYSKLVAANAGVSFTDFVFKEGDIPLISDMSELYVSVWPGGSGGYYNWFQSVIKTKNVNFETREVSLERSVGYEPLGTGSRYFVEGAYELLDAPGEFYCDNNGYLYYYPINENIEEQNIVIPVAGNILTFSAKSETAPVHNIRFDGVTICNSDAHKYGVYMKNALWITIENCNIFNIGGTGVYTDNWCHNIRVEGCKINDMGNGGIEFSGEHGRVESISRNNAIKGNLIDNVGLIVGHANSVYLNNSGFNYVGHNKIINTKRFGIALQGHKSSFSSMVVEGVQITPNNWNDYNPSRFNVMEFNDISLCYTDSQDAGAIYSWGVGINNVYRNNAIHNNTVNFSMCYPFYFDDGSDESIAYNNIIYDNQNHPAGGTINGVFEMKGVGISAYNNILADNQQFEGAHQKFYSFTSFPMGNTPADDVTVKRNIAYNSGNTTIYLPNPNPFSGMLFADKLSSPVESRYKESDYNLFYNREGVYTPNVAGVRLETMDDWRAWQGGKYDQHSIIGENPNFMNSAAFDYRLRYDSPAHSLGFKDINQKDIGLLEGFAFADSSDKLDRVYISAENAANRSFCDLQEGGTVKLDVEARTEKGYKINNRKATVQFKSDNEAIAQVDSNGLITGVGEGIARITAQVSYNGTDKSTDFNVIVGDEFSEFSMNIPMEGYLPGATQKIDLLFTSEKGRNFIPEDAVYESSDEAVAAVDLNGIITTKSAGTTVITATVKMGGKEFSASTEIIVKNQVYGRFEYNISDRVLKVGTASSLTLGTFDRLDEVYSILDTAVDVSAENGNVRIEKISDGNYSIIPLSSGVEYINIKVSGDGRDTTEKISIGVIDEKSAALPGWKYSNYGAKTKGDFYVFEDGFFALNSDGDNIWYGADDCTFGFTKITLDPNNPKAEITAYFDAWAGAGFEKNESHMGLMFRESDAADSKNVCFRYYQIGALRYTNRTVDGGETVYKAPPNVSAPIYMKLVRDGDVFNAYFKETESAEWQLAGTYNVPMSNEILVGVAGYSQSYTASGTPVMTGMFGNLEIKTGNDVGK